MDSRLRRNERLRRLSLIRGLFESGNSGFIYPLRYMWQVRELTGASEVGDESGAADEVVVNEVAKSEAADASEEVGIGVKTEQPGVSVLFSVPKRNHRRANKRNLLKRRCRESYRVNKTPLVELATSHNIAVDIALIYSTKELHQFNKIDRAVDKIIQTIAKDIETNRGTATNSSR